MLLEWQLSLLCHRIAVSTHPQQHTNMDTACKNTDQEGCQMSPCLQSHDTFCALPELIIATKSINTCKVCSGARQGKVCLRRRVPHLKSLAAVRLSTLMYDLLLAVKSSRQRDTFDISLTRALLLPAMSSPVCALNSDAKCSQSSQSMLRPPTFLFQQ